MLPRTLRMTKEIALRVAADGVMVATALLGGTIVRFMWLVELQNSGAAHRSTLSKFLYAYLASVWWLLLISLGVFVLSGFYTHGRAYRGRYKALVIAQAVSLSYVLFGFLAYLFPIMITVPRSALFLAWGMTLVLLILARTWLVLWKTMIRVEERLYARNFQARTIRNVLVIGGAGYIGSALLPKLLNHGYNVRLLDLLLFGKEPIADLINHPRLEIVQADFRQVDKVVEAMRDIDAVIHLGAIVGDPACALDEELTIEVNLMATRMIAEVAKGSGVSRFIFASTCSVYGASDELLDERSSLKPISLYARSKIASEKVLRKMTDDHFAPVFLRFGTVYGLSGRTRFDLVVNLLAAKAIVDGQITVSGGAQWRPFVHVDDVALAVFKVLAAPQALVSNQIFNVGSDEQNYTIAQVGEIIHRMVPLADLVNMGADTDRRNYRVNFGKIRDILGFTPHWTVEQGIKQVIEAIASGRVKDYRESKYSNVKHLGETLSSPVIRRQNGWAYELLEETSYTQESEEESVVVEELLVRVVGATYSGVQ
ncbi:MAG: NAD-dependent epimerase/dehydratase family protein [Roseiflexaceae bacterium]